MNKLSISIALCTYNGERFLREQLDSIATQTRLPDEVVVGDDCSIDSTLEILEQWAKEVPFPVRITRNEKNLGCAKNFEATMLRCTGEVIFPCDQDDVWLPEKLETIVKLFECEPEIGLIYHNTNVINADGIDLGYDEIDLRSGWMRGNYMRIISWNVNKHPIISGCCSAVRRNIVEQSVPFPVYFGHDVWLYLIAPFFKQVKTIRQSLMKYRVHQKNASVLSSLEKQLNLFFHAKAYYKVEVGAFFSDKEAIDIFRERLEQLPDSPLRNKMLRHLSCQESHIPNRSRVQRNFFLFFPLWFYDILTGKYFQNYQPIQAILFDLITGIINGLTPRKVYGEIRNLMRKVYGTK